MDELEHGLFGRLRRGAGPLWQRYVAHSFVEALGTGRLGGAGFRRYLTQDYLFLIQFARAYALAGYKSTGLADLQAASTGLAAILAEMPLHVRLCAEWGLDEVRMAAEPEAMETVAYTRFVLDRGMAGDLLDLHVVLAPCVLGYAEIGARLAARSAAGNPYAAWITAYAGEEYRAVARSALETLERLSRTFGWQGREAALQAEFNAAVRLETDFWEMGWREGGQLSPSDRVGPAEPGSTNT